MPFKVTHLFTFTIVFIFLSASAKSAQATQKTSLLEVTPAIQLYAERIVRPLLAGHSTNDPLSELLRVAEILQDPIHGIQTNRIDPQTFIIYDKLEILYLGWLQTIKLSPPQKKIVRQWQQKFMLKNPADVFFAPSANDIISNRAAFGCSHFARSFIAVVKALNLINNPKDLRYAITCKAEDYFKAHASQDSTMTINGHQFVLIKIDGEWIALNTSKKEWTAMKTNFNPLSLQPPKNTPLTFASYKETPLLFRKIGKDYNDDCADNSYTALMNIYRSGDPADSSFKWEGKRILGQAPR